MFQFEPTGLKELCSFTGVQDPEYEGKTKWQLIKVINGKVDSLIGDEDKFELLNNIIGKSKKVKSKPLGGSATAINNDRSKHPSNTEDTCQLIFHSVSIDAELRIIREKEAELIRTKQILKQADQQKEVTLPNTSKRGSINTGGNTYFSFRDLSDAGAISTATSLLRKDLKLRGCIGEPNVNQKDRLIFVSVKHHIYDAQRQGYTKDEIVSNIIRSMHSGSKAF